MADENIASAKKAFAALLYGSASFLIVIVNKNVLTGHKYGEVYSFNSWILVLNWL